MSNKKRDTIPPSEATLRIRPIIGKKIRTRVAFSINLRTNHDSIFTQKNAMFPTSSNFPGNKCFWKLLHQPSNQFQTKSFSSFCPLQLPWLKSQQKEGTACPYRPKSHQRKAPSWSLIPEWLGEPLEDLYVLHFMVSHAGGDQITLTNCNSFDGLMGTEKTFNKEKSGMLF